MTHVLQTTGNADLLRDHTEVGQLAMDKNLSQDALPASATGKVPTMPALDFDLNRRRLLLRGGAGVLGVSALPLAPWVAAAQQEELCADGTAAGTPKQMAGPFHLADAPFRDDFRVEGMDGKDLTVRGQVVDVACRPVVAAVLDVWQADPTGVYDTKSFELRGKVRTDAEGRYKFLTLKPGSYGSGFVRTPHIHVRIQADGLRELTTQLYFPDEELNAQDALYHPDLLMSVSKGYAGLSATFNFVMEPA